MFQSRARRSHLCAEIHPSLDGSEVHLLGWLHERRDLGGLRFLILRDRSGKVQLIMNRKDTPEEVWRITDGLKRESVLSVTGMVKRSPQAPGGAEVLVSKVELLASSDDLPLDVVGKTEAELDTRLDYRVLDLRRAAPQAIFRIESTTVRAIRSFLDDSGFMEVFTPKIISTATEGGANLFSVFYYDRLAYLSQSPQLYKEVLTSDFERVYEIAPAFRAEESDTLRHLAEVTMVDAEAAFFDYEDVMDLMTGLIKAVVQEVNSENEEDLKALGRSRLEEVDSIPRLEYDEAVKLLDEAGVPHEHEGDLGTPELKEISKHYPGYYFIVNWPTRARPFYVQPLKDNPTRSESFDLMYGWLELSSGATRVSDGDLLRKRLMEQGLNPESFKKHLMWFRYGMPPHAGFGLGLARLVMALTGVSNVREAVLFPRDKRRLEP